MDLSGALGVVVAVTGCTESGRGQAAESVPSMLRNQQTHEVTPKRGSVTPLPSRMFPGTGPDMRVKSGERNDQRTTGLGLLVRAHVLS
jgi:hypothetical protein